MSNNRKFGSDGKLGIHIGIADGSTAQFAVRETVINQGMEIAIYGMCGTDFAADATVTIKASGTFSAQAAAKYRIGATASVSASTYCWAYKIAEFPTFATASA